MRKKILLIMFLLIFATSFLGWPMFAIAADEVSFAADTTVTIPDSGITFDVMRGSVVDEMVVYGTYVTFTLSANSSVELRSYSRGLLTNSLANTDCTNNSYSKLTLPAQTVQTTTTVTPSSSTCPAASSSGGGGSGSSTTTTTTTTTKSTTTTGQVTATTSAGGNTMLTTAEAASATVDLPANAVTSSTAVAITAENKTIVTSSRPLPSGQNLVGGYVYNFTATAGTTAVTTFSKNLTLTFTYTDSQIAGLNEDTLKIYYWTGTQWSSMGGILDKVNNKITVATNHFTYFTMMGEAGTTPVTMARPSDYGLKEGDLIRAVGDFDIFIISQYGYKRLFLNPVIFNMYGHLGGWSAVKSVAPSTRDAFVTSNYYRYVDSPKVYFVEVTGGDTGIFHWINMTGENFLTQGGKADAIFTINKSELDWYPKGTDKTSL